MHSQTVEAQGLDRAISIFRQDLGAIPAEAFNKKFGPKVRTVADIAYEVGLVNEHVVAAMRGEDLGKWPDGWITAPEHLRDKEAAIAAFEAGAALTLESVNGYSADELQVSSETENGPRSRADRVRFMTLHLWYHSGQLNFIQTLLGDDGWHWK